jgi:hypothetical protein
VFLALKDRWTYRLLQEQQTVMQRATRGSLASSYAMQINISQRGSSSKPGKHLEYFECNIKTMKIST